MVFIRPTRIHFDPDEGLGAFLERIVVFDDGQPIKQGMQVARDLLRRLHIAPDRPVASAYLDLLKADATS